MEWDFTNRYTFILFWQNLGITIHPKVGESQRMAIIYVHNLKAEQEGIRRHIQTHMQKDPEGGCQFHVVLLFLRVPHTQNKQIFLLEVVARDGVAIREHLAIVGENESPRGQSTPRHRDDAIAKR